MVVLAMIFVVLFLVSLVVRGLYQCHRLYKIFELYIFDAIAPIFDGGITPSRIFIDG